MSSNTILVVEDNDATRRAICAALREAGYEPIEAPDGASAIAAAGTRKPALILQDLRLPDVEGHALAADLRRILGGVPLVAVTGFPAAGEEARLARAGFDEILLKPIDSAFLVQRVRALLDRGPSEGLALRSRKILVVDDDVVQLKLARAQLELEGYLVGTATDGVGALEALRADRYDAVLSDILMPRLDGFRLCAAIRADDALRATPVVLMSANYVDEADRELARKSGATAFVARTPDLAAALEALRHAFEVGSPGDVLASPDALREEHLLRVVRQLERQVALNAELARRCAERTAELAVLGAISQALARESAAEAALDEVLTSCLDACGISFGVLYQSESGSKPRVRAYGRTPVSEDELVSFFGHPEPFARALEERRVLLLPSAEVPGDVADALLRASRMAALLFVPLVAAGRSFGGLLWGSEREIRAEDGCVAFARTVAAQVAQALALGRAFERLRRAGDDFRRVLEAAPDGIAIERDGRLVFVNHALARALGYGSREDLLGRSPRDVVPLVPSKAPPRVQDQRDTVRGSAPQTCESRVLRQDGTPALFEVISATLEEFEGGPACLYVARDVTEARRMQAHLLVSDRMVSVGTLAAGVAHEINNPLAAVTANLDLLTRDVARLERSAPALEGLADMKEEIADAREGAERVRHIVRDLQVFSRSDEESRGPVDLHRVVASSLRMAKNELRHRARVVEDLGRIAFVDGNEARLGQVVLNLIVNAAQAIPEGHADENEIRVVTRTDDDGWVVLEVRDTGCGIPPEVQKHVFDPFFTTKPVGVGTGLGLSICHRIVTSLGGEIAFETEPGRGTTFRVRFPPSGAVLSEGAAATPMAAARPVRRARVLVVDDEPSVGKAVRRMLVGHEVVTMTQAREALDRIRAGERFDVVLCDVMMPVVTGMDFHAELLQLDRATADQLVFLTGGAFTPRARAYLEQVPNRRVEKPFDLETIRQIVEERLR